MGEANSNVFGSIHDGVFEGKIITDTCSYFVEHAKRYFPNGTYKDYGFHSVIYDERDVIDDPFAHKRTPSHLSGCGINNEAAQWMNNIQSSAMENDVEDEIVEEKGKKEDIENNLRSPYFKYTKEANEENEQSEKEKYFYKRSRRAIPLKEENRKNTCSLYIQTDPLIWRHIREGIADVSSVLLGTSPHSYILKKVPGLKFAYKINNRVMGGTYASTYSLIHKTSNFRTFFIKI